jgi:hypothetical protein
MIITCTECRHVFVTDDAEADVCLTCQRIAARELFPEGSG